MSRPGQQHAHLAAVARVVEGEQLLHEPLLDPQLADERGGDDEQAEKPAPAIERYDQENDASAARR